jgi:hypothetical protein
MASSGDAVDTGLLPRSPAILGKLQPRLALLRQIDSVDANGLAPRERI